MTIQDYQIKVRELWKANQKLHEALEGIIEIGKRSLENPKYDGYFRTAKEVLKENREKFGSLAQR